MSFSTPRSNVRSSSQVVVPTMRSRRRRRGEQPRRGASAARASAPHCGVPAWAQGRRPGGGSDHQWWIASGRSRGAARGRARLLILSPGIGGNGCRPRRNRPMRTMKVLAGGLARWRSPRGLRAGRRNARPSRRALRRPNPPAATAAQGTLTAVDPAANSITLKSGKKEWTFTLASSAAIHEGSKSITIGDLASHKGHEPRSATRNPAAPRPRRA